MNVARRFPNTPESATAARRFATETLSGSSGEALEAVELMVSELATNCVKHVESGFEITIRRTAGEIRVEVTDEGGGVAEMRSPGPEDVSGRGLRIVDMLAGRWGVDYRKPTGKTVWFLLGPDGC